MSDQDEQPPLTRRERRLREMAETGALDLSEVSQMKTSKPAPAEAPAPQDEIEISPFHEDGTPRSRREMRELREQARARLEAQREAEASEVSAEPEARAEAGAPPEIEASAEAEPEAPAEAEAAAEADAAAEEAEAEAEAPEEAEADAAAEADAPAEALSSAESEAPTETATAAAAERSALASQAPEPTAESAADVERDVPSDTPKPDAAAEVDFDTLIAPPTEPFTVAELREAEAGPEHESGTAAAGAITEQAHASDEDAEHAPDAAPSPEPPATGKPKRRFPWTRNRSDDSGDTTTNGTEAGDTGTDETGTDGTPEHRESEIAATVEAPTVEAPDAGSAAAEREAPVADDVEVTGDAVAEAEAAAIAEISAPESSPADVAGAEQQPADPEQESGYSFPDIAPPEEWRSVFDDPNSRTVPTQGAKPADDFDDLISRAVAQEGTSTSGTSALILPSMPEDTGGISGPIGSTGDLYVTGSLKLPKSIGETGGHSALHDSIEMDPITGEASEDPRVTAEGPAPVSARHAVSARALSGIPVVAKPTKEKSKLPLVLSLTGGGLLVAVVALGVWGASNGMFG